MPASTRPVPPGPGPAGAGARPPATKRRGEPGRRLVPALVAGALGLALGATSACGTGDPAQQAGSGPAPSTAAAPTSPSGPITTAGPTSPSEPITTAGPTTGSAPNPAPALTPTPAQDEIAGPGGGADPSANRCERLVASDWGRVANPALDELSGLAASGRHPGVLWAHNDSGNETALFAIGDGGEDLGRFPLAGVDGVDVEDMALVGGVVHLADIGDNDQRRDEVVVYRFAEPDPASPGPVETIESLRFRYADGPRDAEAFLVDPLTGAMVVITKEFQLSLGQDDGSLLAAAPAPVYVALPPFAAGGVSMLEPAGTVALDELDRRAEGQPADGLARQLGLAGLATGADITADGSVVAVRTYGTIWLFDRPPGATVAEALAGEPCEAPTRPEAQGEAVAFLAEGPGLALVTIGEAVNPAITRIAAP